MKTLLALFSFIHLDKAVSSVGPVSCAVSDASFCQKYWSPSHSDRSKTSHFHAFVWRVRSDCPSLRSSTHIGDIWACHALCAWSCCVCARCLWCWMFLDKVRIWIEHLRALTICAFQYYYYYCCLHWYFSKLAMNYPAIRSKTFDEEYAGCKTQIVTKRSMRQCWLRDVGLQINTNTNRSSAWKFIKFVFRCSVLVPNRWMWSSEHIIVGCFWISQHPQLNFLLVEETLPLWQTITPPSTPTNLALLFCRYLS